MLLVNVLLNVKNNLIHKQYSIDQSEKSDKQNSLLWYLI